MQAVSRRGAAVRAWKPGAREAPDGSELFRPEPMLWSRPTRKTSGKRTREGLLAHAPDTASDSYRLLWAKSEPRLALWRHILDVSAVSMVLPPLPDAFGVSPEQVALIAGLHDVGKADPSFQHRVPALSAQVAEGGFMVTGDPPCRHERVSAGFVQRHLEERMDQRGAGTISRAVGAHHGYWNELPCQARGQRYAAAQERLLGLLCRTLVTDLPGEVCGDQSAFGMLLTGRIVLCDWIASNEEFFSDERLASTDDPIAYLAAAKVVADAWVSRLQLRREAGAGKPMEVVASPRPIQEVLLNTVIPRGLVIIEAPMGEGKTEAAWILGEKWRNQGCDGMYMALPTMATSDSLHARYSTDLLKKLGRDAETKLVHGMAWVRDEAEPEREPEVGDTTDDRAIAAAWFRPTRRAMLAAHGVGTVDQAMLAGMNVKFGFLRLYGLAGRVLVVDEVHAYDAYMSGIIQGLLRWCACLSIPVVLLSATLSAGQKKALVEAYGGRSVDEPEEEAPYPLITVVEPGKPPVSLPTAASSSRNLQIELLPGMLGDCERTAAKAQDLVRDGGCVCVILNTVKQAQEVYRSLHLPESEKILFHARFAAADRQRTAEHVVRLFGKDTYCRPQRCVVVATQVVEQSLDVDFDHMMSEIAPIDLLLQRSGRLHRHRIRADRPVLHVLTPETDPPDFGGTGYVYAAKPLLRTVAILRSLSCCEVQLPRDFRTLIERCYGTAEWEQQALSWEAIRQADQAWEGDNRLLESQARQFVLRPPHARSFQPVGNDPEGDDSDDGTGWRAKTRLGAPDRTALFVSPDQLGRLAGGRVSRREARKLYLQAVRLPAYVSLLHPTLGYQAAEEAQGRLRGLMLLPADAEGVWRGVDARRGGCVEVRYDSRLGLLIGRTS